MADKLEIGDRVIYACDYWVMSNFLGLTGTVVGETKGIFHVKIHGKVNGYDFPIVRVSPQEVEVISNASEDEEL